MSSPTTNGLSHLAVAGYRSLQQLSLPLAGLTVVAGANGCGKSSLYRSLGLIAAAAQRTQVWVIAHAEALIDALATTPG
jgi:predicted ATPase